MTNDPDTNGPEQTIDADFEPAPAADYVVPQEASKRSGPGWLPVGLIGALSAAALGVSVVSMNGGAVDTSGFAPIEISEEIDGLRASLSEKDQQLADMAAASEAAEKKIAEQMEALLSGDEENEGLQALVAELESVSERLDDASLGGANDAVVDALTDRITALEAGDEGEPLSSRQMNRALAAIRKRVAEVEVENEALLAELGKRDETIEALTSRVTDMEFALQDAANGTPSPQGDILADLQEEMANLRVSVERTEDIDLENEKRFSDMLKSLQSVGAAEEQAGRAEETASAALAVSRIEAAAREGRSFNAAYRQLEKAMPTERAVQALKPISQTGAPTVRDLTKRFPSDRDAALEAYDETSDDGWGWTRQVFGSGVKVRKAGDAGGPRELLNQAEDALEDGDLHAAIDAIENLPEEAAAIMADWLSGAQNRITLEEALEDIGVKLIGRDQ